MKRLHYYVLMIVASSLLGEKLSAQNTLGVSLYSNHSGNNFALDYSFGFEKSDLTFGVKVLLKNPQRIIENYEPKEFKKQFHAQSFKEFFGANILFRKYVPVKNHKKKLGVFYNAQFINSSTKNISLVSPDDCDCDCDTDDELFLKSREYFGAHFQTEHALGISINGDFSKRVHFSVGGGVGFALIRVSDSRMLPGNLAKKWYLENFGMFFVQVNYSLR